MNEPELNKSIKTRIQSDTFWNAYLKSWSMAASTPFKVHLAIFVPPYLDYILSGKKTVESRFSANKCAPYGRVNRGDVLLLKKSGGPIVGLCQVSNVWTYQLDSESWKDIRNDYAESLCAQDPDFWTDRKHASFATLMRIKHAVSIEPIFIDKHDRRGWVVLGIDHKVMKQRTLEFV